MNKLKNINTVAKKLNIKESNLYHYGNYMAKVSGEYKNKGKLILVTSTNPTPYGEGKTTISIGINDSLCKIGEKSIAVLREPSLGPVFGVKGGATGGNKATIEPSLDIDLHFTGDMHSITSANNLIAAYIDNHIYHGNKLNFKTVVFKRCLDLNDRALRNVSTFRPDSFEITAASELMSIFCLAKNIEDLKQKIDNILLGFDKVNLPIYFRSFDLTSNIILLLKQAFIPNIVQSIYNNPVIVHGGPFANVSIGTSSISSIKLGLSLADYVITEAGFGSDLGAEKFFDILCRENKLTPDLVIINVSTKALKHNGYAKKNQIDKPNMEYLKKGICNLEAHILNMKQFSKNILVVLNKFDFDTEDEINYIKEFVNNMEVDFEVSTSFIDGEDGAIKIAKYITKLKKNKIKFVYDLNDTIETKINKICTNIYHSKKIRLNKDIKNKIKVYNKLGYYNLPICIAKTPNSLTSNKKIFGFPKNYKIKVTNIDIKTGAGFIIVYLGDIITMPGLPSKPIKKQD